MKNYKYYVIFDTETTGLKPEECQIIEFAALILNKDGVPVKEVDEFIRASYIPPEITELTGITAEQTASGLTPKDFCQAISKFPPALWIAHNAQFDLSFLKETLQREGYDFDKIFESSDFLDTLTVYRDRADKPHRLENAIEHYKCTGVQNSHRAIDDVKALWAVMKAMTKERNDLGKYVNLFGVSTKSPLPKVRYVRQSYGFKDRGRRLCDL